MYEIKLCPSKEYKTVDDILFKKCSKCNIFKELVLFTRDKYSRDKRTNSCTLCRNAIPQDRVKIREAYRTKGKTKKAEYYQKNKEKIHKQRQKRLKESNFLMLYNRFRKYIRKQRIRVNGVKRCKSVEILGCTKKELFLHLQKTFETNYNIPYKDEYFDDLHIDHIVPMSLAKTEDDLEKLNHYSNLQFLHKAHNMEKKSKLDYKPPKYPDKL